MLSVVTQKLYEAFYSPEPRLPVWDDNDASKWPKKTRLHVQDFPPKLAYIRQLPRELLVLVFHFYLEQPEHRPSPGAAIRTPALTSTPCSSSASPFVLSCVCSSWRMLLLVSPALWSSLAVYRPRMSQLPTVKLWLSRSGDYPLSLSIHQPFIEYDNPVKPTEHILRVFSSYAHRWREISIKLQDDFPHDFLLSIIPTQHLSMLESVELNFNENDYTSPIWQALYSLPTLRKIVWPQQSPQSPSPSSPIQSILWSPAYLQDNLTTPRVPWSQLTHIQLLHLNTLHIDDLLRTLIFCPNAISLELSLPLPTSPQPYLSPRKPTGMETAQSQRALRDLRALPPPNHNYITSIALTAPRIPPGRKSAGIPLGRAMKQHDDLNFALLTPMEMPHLRYLKIHAHGRGGGAGPLLDRLKVPDLERLVLLHYPALNSGVIPPLLASETATSPIIRLLERSVSSRFHSLSVYDPEMTEGEMVMLVSSPWLGWLQELELFVSPVGDALVETLTLPVGHEHLYPQQQGGKREGQAAVVGSLRNLKRLVIPDCMTSKDGLLTQMVLSRRPRLGTLVMSVGAESTQTTPIHRDVASLRMIATNTSFCFIAL